LINRKASSPALKYQDYIERNREFFVALDNLQYLGFARINIANHFCSSTECVPFNDEGLPLYNDFNHLNKIGLEYVSSNIADVAIEALNDN